MTNSRARTNFWQGCDGEGRDIWNEAGGHAQKRGDAGNMVGGMRMRMRVEGMIMFSYGTY